MIPDDVAVGSFEEFVKRTEPRLRHALSATHGLEAGREATADALAYGWEHWDRVGAMENPAGYLFRVGRSRARRLGRRPVLFPEVDTQRWPWVEPGLSEAVRSLSEKQRAVVVLLHCFDWTHSEVAELLGIARGSVQRHGERALRKLRAALGVGADA